jgi:hypothetical protein
MAVDSVLCAVAKIVTALSIKGFLKARDLRSRRLSRARSTTELNDRRSKERLIRLD